MTSNRNSATFRPSITIGMPVYNGERFLGPALDSLLVQTYADFELVIADNASTDRTRDICAAYCARDSRIRYVRHTANLGSPRNWNFVANQARGEFFKWASASDLCAPGMLSAYVQALRQDGSVALVYGRTMFIDEEGQELSIYEDDPEITDSSPARRFMRAMLELRMNNAQAGLIRTAVLRQTRLEPIYPGGDMVLMAEIALGGGYLRLPDILFYRRTGRLSSTGHLNERELKAFLNPSTSQTLLPVWRLHFGYMSALLRAALPLPEKAAALSFLAKRMYWDRRPLWEDALRALRAAWDVDA